MSYSTAGYYMMIADRVRTAAYTRALEEADCRDSVVLDIGTGCGYFAVLACQLGAVKVHAVEPDPIIEIAREVAVTNGVADAIEFHPMLSTEVTLPRPADILISDLRGILPFFGQHIRSIVDARTRLLREGGVQIPARDDIFAAFVCSERIFADYALPSSGDALVPDIEPLVGRLRNSWTKARVKLDECASPSIHLRSIDYSTVEATDFQGSLSWEPASRCTSHGICVWFDTVLYRDIGYSNAPGAPEAIYGQAFFPFETPLHLEKGDIATVSLRAVLIRGEYVWSWDTEVRSKKDDGAVRVAFRQSVLKGNAPMKEALHRQANAYVPPASDSVQMKRFVLERVDGNTSLEAIARELAAKFPAKFASWSAALPFVGAAVESAR
jgi:protein arginine N-methyltransferase 1